MPDLFEVRHSSVIASLMASGAVDARMVMVDHVRHEPNQRTVVGFTYSDPDGRFERAHAVRSSSAERAGAAVQVSDQGRRRGRSAAAPWSADEHTLIQRFPGDAVLRDLRGFVETSQLRKSMLDMAGNRRISSRRSTTRILRYKPEHQLVVRADLCTTRRATPVPIVIRKSARATAHQRHRVAQVLRRHGVRTPPAILSRSGGTVGVDRYFAGAEVGFALADRGLSLSEVVSALTDLHDIKIPAWLPTREAADLLGTATSGLQRLSAWEPSLVHVCNAAVEAMEQAYSYLEPVEPRVVHGDLGTENILVSSTGEIAFIDLERVSVGDPGRDLGRLVEALARDGATPVGYGDRLVDEYFSTHGPSAMVNLDWYRALALVESAQAAAWCLSPEWESTALELLTDAARHCVRMVNDTRRWLLAG
jgi:aminoglycoside phosphotransferase (APT) family kinase protein